MEKDERPNLGKLSNLTKKELLLKLKTSEKGLSDHDVALRLKKYGYNELEKSKKSFFLMDLLRNYINPFVIILIISTVVFGLTHNIINAIIIIMILSISIGIDYYQYHRSLSVIEKLQSKVAIKSTVLRENKINKINTKELVLGDILILTAGNVVPADAILLSSKNLTVQQSLLTGETYPVEKKVGTKLKVTKNIFEAQNILFSETSIISGSATAVIIKTGSFTEFGKLAKCLGQRRSKTEFEIGLIKFGVFISKTIIFLILFIFLMSIILKRDLLESLMFSAALAVGLTPEFLPMMITVNLATSAMKMSQENVVVKNISAMMNFASIDILCSDKTGTLTTGVMDLLEYVDVYGNRNEKIWLYSYLNSLINSQLDKINLHPLDIAILGKVPFKIPHYQIVDLIPFDYERKRSTVVLNLESSKILITKGTPEGIIDISKFYDACGTSMPLNHEVKAKIIELYESFSMKGYKTLCVAYRNVTTKSSYNLNDEIDLILLGILVFTDPLIPEVASFINDLKDNGVKIKILTGDHHLIAKNICNQVGIDAGESLRAEELDQMSDQMLNMYVENCNLFTRTSPIQKLRIVNALKHRGHVVGYLGDSVNDAPALQSADIGISVFNAVDIAKKSSDVILLKANLKVLLTGIIEGRKAYANIIKYLIMGTSSNFGNMCSMAGAILFLPFLPMLPIQVLLNNFLYDISQLTIPTDNVDSAFTKKPQHWDIRIIKRCMFFLGPISTLFDFITFYMLSNVFLANESMFQTGWFIESLATQTLVILIMRTTENPYKNPPSIPLLLSIVFVIIFGTAIPLTPLASKFGFVQLPYSFYVFIMFSTLLYLLLIQTIKQQFIKSFLSVGN